MQDIPGGRRPTISAEAAEALQRIIIDMELQPGDKLPSQAELGARLGVGSRSIREAIKTLEARGLVETHQGKGVFVKNATLDFFLEVLNDSLVFDLYRDKKRLLELTQLRWMIESNVIHDLAEHPDPEMLKKLVDIVDKMARCEEPRDIEPYNMLDAKFHVTLIEACGNDILITLYRNLAVLLIKSVVKTGYMKGSLQQSLTDHRQILEALVARDPGRAKELMERHLSTTRERLARVLA
jgi:GntR family transcriptional repressor for pyruvate dehydrogenase complex